jgi:K+-sensing histidine kinase KdpD
MAEIVLEKKQEPAKLRIYLGAAPGVGKTYDMLNDAHRMKHQLGVDVVIGLVESHGRAETEARIRDLEIVPQKVIPYRGVNLKEMDVDASWHAIPIPWLWMSWRIPTCLEARTASATKTCWSCLKPAST